MKCNHCGDEVKSLITPEAVCDRCNEWMGKCLRMDKILMWGGAIGFFLLFLGAVIGIAFMFGRMQ